MTAYWCASAWLPEGLASDVRLVVADGVLTGVERGAAALPGDVRLPGVVLPGFADAHSHAFHRALRGRTGTGGDFWSWRRTMYAVAAALTPDSMYELARAAYAEMVLAGTTAVGEFHYLHHPASGRYDDPNAMGQALRAAARDAGLRLTLLDACYLTGGIGRPLEGVQTRFGDGDAERWADRVGRLRADDTFRVGAAVHSVRAVPPAQIGTVAAWAAERGAPWHAHLSEQRAENEACQDAYGRSPAQVIEEADALGPGSTVVHAVHLEPTDVVRLGRSRTTVCVCPSTERDLADGMAPAAALRTAGSPLCVGSDQHVTADLLAEVQALEMHERLRSGRRGVLPVVGLVDALTQAGHRAIGWPEAGRLEVGAVADLVALRSDSVRTAGSDAAQVVMVAGATDVDTVVVAGRTVVRDGAHVLGDVAGALGRAVGAVLEVAS